jgi:hypothetical protein
VTLLPIPNTTAEMLARYLCERLKDELRAGEYRLGHLTDMAVEVEETFGQSGIYREEVAL